MNVLNTHASGKNKIIRANNLQFMTQTLQKAIMTRSRLRNVYLKNQKTTNWNNYKHHQQNLRTNLLQINVYLASSNIALKEKISLITEN